MDVPSVVIVGRPNVGKSSLFNAMCGRRISIVDPVSGVTRDRVAAEIRHEGRSFELVDTGGMGLQTSEELAEDIEMQINIAIDQAEVVLFVVDLKEGRQPLDQSIGLRLRRGGKNAVLVANKCDGLREEKQAVEFFALGFGEPAMTSAVHRRGVSQLLDRVVAMLPQRAEAPVAPEPMKIAFVGRRNVGKSTLINWLAQEQRVIVSETPGTTRDAVDVRFRMKGLEFLAIDTAGMRRKDQMKDSVDFYSFSRARASVRRADVVVHLTDAPSEISRVDKKLASEVVSNFKPCVLAVNKMDLVPEVPGDSFREYVWANLPGLWFAPVVCISALTGAGVPDMLEQAYSLYGQSSIRVPTGELNETMEEIQARRRPPSKHTRPGKIFYATQVAIRPPTIVLFTNESASIDEAYRRYLANQFRSQFEFHSIPIKFLVRTRKRGLKHKTL